MSARDDYLSLQAIEERGGVISVHCWPCRRYGWIFPHQLTGRYDALTPYTSLRYKCDQCGRYADRKRIFVPAEFR